jgi:hypothetical protein
MVKHDRAANKLVGKDVLKFSFDSPKYIHISVVLAFGISISVSAVWELSLPVYVLLNIHSDVSFQSVMAVATGVLDHVV